MPRPWYRSLVFWLGIPFPPFLGWLWWWSMQIGRGWQWVLPTRSIFFSLGGSTLRFGTDDASLKATDLGLDAWEWDLASCLETVRWFPPPGLETDFSIDQVVLVIPHWLAILLFTAAWLGTLAAWQRRKRRLHQACATTGCPAAP